LLLLVQFRQTVVAAAFVRALVVLVVVGAGVTDRFSPVEALVAAVDLLAMVYESE
jgi:hypothetical protein